MFQVEADVKWTWLQIGRKALGLTASWLHFFAWRIVTVVPGCLTIAFLKRAMLPGPEQRRNALKARRRPDGQFL